MTTLVLLPKNSKNQLPIAQTIEEKGQEKREKWGTIRGLKVSEWTTLMVHPTLNYAYDNSIAPTTHQQRLLFFILCLNFFHGIQKKRLINGCCVESVRVSDE
jgi:hypothetical protein